MEAKAERSDVKGNAMSRRHILFSALVLGWWCSSPACAGDIPAPSGVSAVIVHPGGNCTACEVVPMSHTRVRLTPHHNWLENHKPLPPITVNLCPGACFGHFQTQWRKWEDACPYPYTGSYDPIRPEIPNIPSASDAAPGKNGTLPDPRIGEPKKMKSSIAPLNIPGTRIN